MGRRGVFSSNAAKEDLNRGAWSFQEDQILINYIKTHGARKWRLLSQKSGLKRCGKSCRLRWLNYLRPNIKRGDISEDEQDLIIRLHNLLGNRWSLIAGRLPGRTDNEIKNYWNAHIAKRLCYENQTSLSKPIGSTTLEKKQEKQPQGLGNNPKVIRTKAIRCSTLKFPIMNRDQKGYDQSTTAVDNTSSLWNNEWANDDDRNKSTPITMNVSNPTSTNEGLVRSVIHDHDHEQCLNKTTNTNDTITTTTMKEGVADHHDLNFLFDLDFENVNNVFDLDRVDILNPNVDDHYLMHDCDQTLYLDIDHYDPHKNVHVPPLPYLGPLMDANNVDETNIDDKAEDDHEINSELN